MNQEPKPYLHSDLSNYTRGWLVGNFDPAIFKSDKIEVALKTYKAGDKEDPHYHKLSDEYTIILDGSVIINKIIYSQGSIICIPAKGISHFEAIEDTKTLVIRTASFPNDKYLCED